MPLSYMARTITVASDTGQGQRKRKTHQKSRRGCRNCKLRRVKCDETQPGCEKCSNFGVSCNYDDPHAPDLQATYHGVSFEVPLKRRQQKHVQSRESCFFVGKLPVFDTVRLGMTRISDDGGSTVEIDSESLGRLNRFVTRTVLSVGPPHTAALFQNDMVGLVCGNPYLMHMVLALTALHDRMLLPNPSPRQTAVELYHASRAAALFNAKLSQPLQPEDRDPLWVTATLLGIASMCWVEASGAEDAWPLTVRKPTDLNWIRISRSKAAVWDLTEPMRKGGRFRCVAQEKLHHQKHADISASKAILDELPLRLRTLCEVDERSTVESNPYYSALLGLAPAMGVESSRANLLILLGFLGRMTDSFQGLLSERDPRALLLMAYWYGKVYGTMWWLDQRSTLECQAICMYLERYHPEETEILDMLWYPKMRCGLMQ